MRVYELALKVTGAVQARRWTPLSNGGFIYSFNGAHSLFVDTIRTLRALALSHVLGHRLLEEQDASVNLLERLLHHARATATYSVYHGTGRDTYDVRGRCAHESLFNAANGTYRGPSSQQGYSPFSTWTRGLAWAMLGFAEQLEFLEAEQSERSDDAALYDAACATCDFYIEQAAASDGVPYWDTGAPGLASLGDWASRPADPFNDHEPVDSSAAAIAVQGLLRFARVAAARGGDGKRYEQAGLRALETLLDEGGPYLSLDSKHEGLLLHSVYHRPNGWDHVPERIAYTAGRIEHVGGLPFAGGGTLRQEDCRRRHVLHVLRTDMSLRRIALVTGGTRGIGLGIARALARDGWALALCGLRPRDEVTGVLEELSAATTDVQVPGPPTSAAPRDRIQLLASLVAHYGTLHALVNNAGRAPRIRADLLSATEESFEEVVRTNLQGPYFLTQAVARLMVNQQVPDKAAGRAIVFVTSVSAAMASPHRGEYCVSKAALSMAATLFAVRLASDGIPVYEVRPGIIATDMTAGVKEAYDKRIREGLVPDARWGDPEDVGRAVAALLRGDMPYATGTVINVDGGLSIPRPVTRRR